MIKKWNTYTGEREDVQRFAADAGVSEEIAGILWHRGIRTAETARAFLDPEGTQVFHDPFLMKDMDQATDRILSAIREGEKITVYGDYDVDGITATSLLLRNLRRLGAVAECYIPDRQKEGYGLNEPALRSLASHGTKLVVSVDCGIASLEEVNALRGVLDIVITDHHLPGNDIPEAVAVVNPHREDCPYPDKNLAGVGVAFKLCQALWQKKEGVSFREDTEFVALGTIADIVPLLGENRKLVKMGLRALPNTKFLGLQALIEVSGLQGKEIGSGQVGFMLAPRLNASGRIGRAMEGVRLLLSEDKTEADGIAATLNEQNIRRQEIEREILELAEEKLAQMDLSEAHSIVLDGEDWHPGVIGIVASRLVDKHYLPTIVISRQGDLGKGSCRSIRGLHMYEALCACEECLLGFGGHSQAAGLTIAAKDIDRFRRMFDDYVAKTLSKEDYIPSINIEFERAPQDMDIPFIEELAKLEPYGMGNPKPLFGCRSVRGLHARQIGRDGQHLAFDLESPERTVTALSWNNSAFVSIVNAEALDIVYVPQISEWQGRKSVEVILQEIQPTQSERIFPDRGLLVKIYTFLKELGEKKQGIPLDAYLLTAGFSKRFGHISLYSMKYGLQVFQELGLLHGDLEEKRYLLPPTKGKMDLMQSSTYRIFTTKSYRVKPSRTQNRLDFV